MHLPAVQLPSVHVADVSPAALTSPLEVYGQIFQDALASVGTLAENTRPGQVLEQFLANQISSAGALAGGLLDTGRRDRHRAE